MFVLTAHDRDGLRRQARTMAEYLESSAADHELSEAPYLRDLAFTLAERRTKLPWRITLQASSLTKLISELKVLGQDLDRAKRPTNRPRIGFVFTGQGAQWPQMGSELLKYRVYRESIHSADQYLCKILACPWSALTELTSDEARSNINLPAYSQPLCTILQIALVDLLESWGIEPSAIVGHSSGEIAAAYCLGAITKQDAWRIAYQRGLLSSEMSIQFPKMKGGMLAVGLSEEDAEAWLSDRTDLVVACVNSPSSVTLSGNLSTIQEMEKSFNAAGIFTRKLKVGIAYHSPHMETISASYLEAIKDVHTQPGHKRRMFSAVTGSLVDAEELGPVNWVRNLVSPVLFYPAMSELLKPGSSEHTIDLLVEIGPHAALKGPTSQIMRDQDIEDIEYYSILSRGKSAIETAFDTVQELYGQGVPINLSQVNDDIDARLQPTGQPLIDLPAYCWNHSRSYWSESRVSRQYRLRERPAQSLIGAPCPRYGENERMWRGFLRPSEEPWVKDHQIQSTVIFPAAGYLAMAIEGASQMATSNSVKGFKLRDIKIVVPAVISENTAIEFILQIRPHQESTRDDGFTWQEFTVSSCNEGHELRKNCFGLLLIEFEPPGSSAAAMENRLAEDSLKARCRSSEVLCGRDRSIKSFYEQLDALGLNYGPTFRGLTTIRSTKDEGFCTLTIPKSSFSEPHQRERPHVIHPSTLDAMFHTLFVAIDHESEIKEAMVPQAIEEINIAADVPYQSGSEFKGFSKTCKHGFREMIGDLVMLDAKTTRPCVTMSKIQLTIISGTHHSANEAETNAGKLYSTQIWKPALDVYSSDEKSILMDEEPSPSDCLDKSVVDQILAFCKVLKTIKDLPVKSLPDQQIKSLVSTTSTKSRQNGKVEDNKITPSLSWPVLQLGLSQMSTWQILRASGMLDSLFQKADLEGCCTTMGKVLFYV